MSLQINRGKVVLPDQTPTPTRFLKICDQEGLFDTLKDNPFDHEFSKSVPSEAHDSVGGDQEQPQQVVAVNDVASSVAITNAAAFSIGSLTAPTPIISSPYAVASIPVAPPNSIENPKKMVPVATPPNKLPDTAASQQMKLSLRQKIQHESMKKAMMQMPSGMDMSTLVGAQIPTTPEIIQEAFKNALSQGTPPFMTPALLQQSSQPSPTSSYSEGSPRRRSRTKDDADTDDPAEKRKRFLERNRAAAARCRSKKKQWVENLEVKAKSMEEQNQSFQEEIVILKQEVQNLKNILMAHRDCPLLVSQQEQLKQLQTVDYNSVLSGPVALDNTNRPNSTSTLSEALTMSPSPITKNIDMHSTARDTHVRDGDK
jgi:hypothetical protein